jgi:hypothetical protein
MTILVLRANKRDLLVGMESASAEGGCQFVFPVNFQ